MSDPARREVRVAIEAIGLGRAEVLFSSGRYLEAPRRFPARRGYEAAGTVSAVRSGVTRFAVRDAVSVVPAFTQKGHGLPRSGWAQPAPRR